MAAWTDEYLNVLSKNETEQDLYCKIAEIARDLGFKYCGYRIQIPVPVSYPIAIKFQNYPQAWVEHYEACNYSEIDPILKHASASNKLLIWPDKFCCNSKICEDARSHGLCFGWAKPSRDANGTIAILTLARNAGRLKKADLLTNNVRMSDLAEMAHAGMAKLVLSKHAPEANAKITVREKEILRWTAAGKTAYEIGQILLISENTVVFHLKNVLIKLKASNKIQAAVKATALGLLW